MSAGRPGKKDASRSRGLAWPMRLLERTMIPVASKYPGPARIISAALDDYGSAADPWLDRNAPESLGTGSYSVSPASIPQQRG